MLKLQLAFRKPKVLKREQISFNVLGLEPYVAGRPRMFTVEIDEGHGPEVYDLPMGEFMPLDQIQFKLLTNRVRRDDMGGKRMESPILWVEDIKDDYTPRRDY